MHEASSTVEGGTYVSRSERDALRLWCREQDRKDGIVNRGLSNRETRQEYLIRKRRRERLDKARKRIKK